MDNDTILLILGTIVLFIIWIALNLNIRARRKKLGELKKINYSHYVAFVHNYNKAEEAEKNGKPAEALEFYKTAKSKLESEENPDEMVKEALEEVEQKIQGLTPRQD